MCRSTTSTDRINLGDRPYFKAVVAGAPYAMGEYTVGRITGSKNLPFAHPVRDAQGALVAVAFLGMDLRMLGERLRPVQWLGAGLGFVGLTMVIWHKLAFDGAHLWALFFAFVQLFGITAATLYQKRFSPNADLKAGAAIQYAAATLVLVPVMLLVGVGEVDWQPQFIAAMAWIVIVLSGISIALLTWMIQRGAASKVASLFYLTPPVAALGAFFWFDERLDALALCGMGVVALGVYLVNRR
mgnify:CR=1 FL=1